MRTFQYTGKGTGCYVQTPYGNVGIKKGEKYETDDEVIARTLSEAPDVKEVTKDAEEKKASPKRPDGQS